MIGFDPTQVGFHGFFTAEDEFGFHAELGVKRAVFFTGEKIHSLFTSGILE
jgi:hypothetical protein